MSPDPSSHRAVKAQPPVRAQASGFVTIEHEFTVPLDHSQAGGPTIDVFAREVAAPEGRDRPYLVYFAGGPGHEAPRPLTWTSPSWIQAALREFRILFLDQRGTGRSSPIDVTALSARAPAEQADYLKLFRADAIVRDAELIRDALGVTQWSVIGESFGGFCILAYLSSAPDGLAAALISGGLPPVARPIDDVYRATYRRVLQKTERYYARYPGDRARIEAIHGWLAAADVALPSGDVLTTRRFRQLGWGLGMCDGLEALHHIVELPRGSSGFLHDVERTSHFARNPLYAIIHEACYADGCATRWSASRLLDDGDPMGFTGEHVYPWMFENYGGLAPLREAADILAEHEWGRLYDEEQLRRNRVPTAAAIYADDMYVERAFSEETAALTRGVRPWLTSQFEHDGLRASGDAVFQHLLQLARGHE